MFEPVNDLERLLMDAATDPSMRSAFKEKLLQSDLFAASPGGPEVPLQRATEPGEKLTIMNASDSQGKPIPAVFTSQARVAQAFGPEAGFVRLNGATLLDLFTERGAVLNPGSSYGVVWTADELSHLLGKLVERTIQEETEVLLSVPSEPPKEHLSYLQTVLANEPVISEAWLALAHWPRTGERSWYLDVRSSGPADDARRVMAGVLKRTTFDRYPIDLVVSQLGTAAQGIRIKPLNTH